MRAVLMHLSIPDRSQIQSGYRGFVNDAQYLIAANYRLAEAVWLIPPADYQKLEPQLLQLCRRHGVGFETLEVDATFPWQQHP